MNAPGGQFSSLSDLIRLAQVVLDPTSFPVSGGGKSGSKGIISQKAVDRWLKPVTAFEEDDLTELGMMWEIIKHPDSRGRLRRLYWKRELFASWLAATTVTHVLTTMHNQSV